jgi:glycosyltransferase involved in cell wall biosynthesis
MRIRPRVSIGLPIYNGEPFLQQALDSLLSQTHTDFELVISDNASTDRTSEICAAYTARDPRIRYHRNAQNIGVDRNFNRTFELSQGEYFRWAAADDLCAPTLLERCVEVLDARQDVVLCYPKSRYIDDQGGFLRDYEDNLHIELPQPHKRFAAYLLNVEMCNAVFGLIRSSVLRQTKLYGIYADSDLVYLGELALYGSFLELPEVLFFRRIHPGIAVKKYPSAHERMVMSEPALGDKLSFPHWKVFGGFLSAIRRAPLSWSERLFCYLEMRIWLERRGRGEMGLDLKVAVRHFLRKLRRKRRTHIPESNEKLLLGTERKREETPVVE